MSLLHFFPVPFLIGLAVLAGFWIHWFRRGRPPVYRLALPLFGLYLLLLIDAVVFPIPLHPGPGPVLTGQNISFTLSRVNLIHLDFGNPISQSYLFTQLVQNILLTVPFGFGINFLARLRARDFLWLAAATGCAAEASQLLVSIFIVGGLYRSVDINDVLLNAGGVLLGYGLFRIMVGWIHPRSGT